ncbi:hypothetical protein EON65_52560, partial [archaeon]
MSTKRVPVFLFFIYTLMISVLTSSLHFSASIFVRKLLYSSTSLRNKRLYGTTRISTYKFSLKSSSESTIEQKLLLPSDSKENLLKKQVAVAIKTKDSEKIKMLRDEITNSNNTRHIHLFANLISACEKASDLPIALQIIQDLKSTQVTLTEAIYLPLIRCYIDANNLTEAWKYVKLIANQDKGHVRHRTLQPLFDYCLRTEDMTKALEVFAYMTEDLVLSARSNHIALLLKIYLKTPKQAREKVYMAKMHEILQKNGGLVWGLLGDEIWELMALTS